MRALALIAGSTRVFQHHESLKGAISRAVAESKRAAAEIEGKVCAVRHSLIEAAQTLARFEPTEIDSNADPTSLVGAWAAELAQASAGLNETYLRRSEALDHVNLVLFGRTGVGKSSLIEAMTHGDGASVSQGESDWTVDVRPVTWHECQLVDTPGINGWGRTESRAELEEKARLAVEAADIVLLCFDSQSQQEAEFSKVAEWVQAYGKPTIAIINNRNREWRDPTRVSRRDRRANLSRTMLQHEGNVRDGLVGQGFTDVPIICLSSKRALIARARLPFRGPDANTMASMRSRHGAETLLRWSNLPALEALLIQALTQDAAGIRLGMLTSSLRGDLAQLSAVLDRQAAEASARAEILDLSIGRLLRLLGYPEPRSPARPAYRDGNFRADYLTWLEEMRGGRFAAPLRGQFQEHVSRMLAAALGRERARSLDRAEDAVIRAFNLREAVPEIAFDKVYNQAAIEAAGNAVVAAARDFLEVNVELLTRDVQRDLVALSIARTRIEGQSGRGWRRAAIGARGAGIAIQAGAAALAFMAAAPAVAVAGVAVALLSVLAGWFGRRATLKAEGTRAAGRRKALADARRTVNMTFDGFAEEVARAASAEGHTALAHMLRPLLHEAVGCHLVLQQIRQVRTVIAQVEAALPQREPGKVLLDAAMQVEERRHPGHPAAGRLVWAGEDWLDDPTGLTMPREAGLGNAAQHDPPLAVPPPWHLTADPRPVGQGRDFVALAEQKLGFASAAPVLEELRGLVQLDRPAIHLIGDYNAGKTSFVRRLLAEAGLPVPDSLVVRADPTTNVVTRHDLGGAWLVDAPGLQSRREGDSAVALDAIADASVVVWLLHGSVLDTSIGHLAATLTGDARLGRAGKLDRTLIMLARSDELGRDPIDDPGEFRRVVQRKHQEIIKALVAKGVAFPKSRLLAVAADPYGRVGDASGVTARDFDADRSWDGIDDFLAGLGEIVGGSAGPSMVDASILEGGLVRLARFDRELAQVEAALQEQESQCLGMLRLLEDALAGGGTIWATIESGLDRLLEETTSALTREVYGARDADELHTSAQRLARWWDDEVFTQELAAWEKASHAEIDGWAKQVSDLCSRRLESHEFRPVSPATGEAYSAKDLCERNKVASPLLGVLQAGVRHGSSRDIVYAVGKSMGVKFRPWGAVKIARGFAKAAAVLAVIGSGLDAWDWWASHKAGRKREEAINGIAEFIRSSREDVRQSLLGGDEQNTGPAAYLHERLEWLRGLKDEITADRGEWQRSMVRVSAERAAVMEVMRDGWARRGAGFTENPDA